MLFIIMILDKVILPGRHYKQERELWVESTYTSLICLSNFQLNSYLKFK